MSWYGRALYLTPKGQAYRRGQAERFVRNQIRLEVEQDQLYLVEHRIRWATHFPQAQRDQDHYQMLRHKQKIRELIAENNRIGPSLAAKMGDGECLDVLGYIVICKLLWGWRVVPLYGRRKRYYVTLHKRLP